MAERLAALLAPAWLRKRTYTSTAMVPLLLQAFEGLEQTEATPLPCI